MLLDRIAATVEPHRLYTNGDTTTIMLPRDVRPTLLRYGALAFCVPMVISMLDAAATGGASSRWLLLWALLAALCLVLARKDSEAGRHATLVIRRPNEDGEPAETGLYIGGLEVARADTLYDQFRVYQVSSSDGPAWLRARLSYWVMLMNSQIAVAPYETPLPAKAPHPVGLRIERCLHPEDAARLVRQLHVAAGAPPEVISAPVDLLDP